MALTIKTETLKATTSPTFEALRNRYSLRSSVIPPFFGALKSRGHAACAKRCFGV